MSRRILIVDDDASARMALEFHFRREGWEAHAAGSAEQALGAVHDFRPDLVLTDVHMGGMTGLELLEKLHAAMPGVDVIVMTGYDDMGTTIRAMRGGAYDFLAKPLDLEQLDLLVARCLRDRAARARAQEGASGADEALAYGVGRSPKMIEIYKLIGVVSGTRRAGADPRRDGNGQGAGGARASTRSGAAGAGALRGRQLRRAAREPAGERAVRPREGRLHRRRPRRARGLFEQADGGTLFLDEIGDIPLGVPGQAAARAPGAEFRRPWAATKARKSTCASSPPPTATSRSWCAQGSFREDLYYRLQRGADRASPRCASAGTTCRPLPGTCWPAPPAS